MLLKRFSKALRPTGVECADNSWPFWSVTSLGSCAGRKSERRGNVLMALARRFETLFWQLFNYLQMNGMIGGAARGEGRYRRRSVGATSPASGSGPERDSLARRPADEISRILGAATSLIRKLQRGIV